MAQRQQREDRLRVVGAARQLDRALEVLARLGGVADAAEHAAEDAVRAARRPRLAEALGEAQRLLGGVDREHVVAGLHVEPRRLLVQPHELERRRPVLEQVDALLVVLDRLLALALVPQAGADLAVQVGDALEVLAAAVVARGTPPTRRSPRRPARGAAPRRPASRRSARTRLVVARVEQLARRLVVGERLAVGVQRARRRRRRPRGSCSALAWMGASSAAGEPRLAGQRRGAAVVLGEQRDDLVGAVARRAPR